MERKIKMSDSKKKIAIVATLDTKGEEGVYLKDAIQRKGCSPLLVDVGVYKGSYSYEADVTNEQVAELAGFTLDKIQKRVERQKGTAEAMEIMAKGLLFLLSQLVEKGELGGVLCIGGSTGTSLGLKVMRELPVIIPKLMLSTVAFTPLIPFGYMAIDQVLMQTIADLRGVNIITRMVLERAANAICGMASAPASPLRKKRPVIALTGLGGTKVAELCIPFLRQRGFEPVVFHSIGTGACEKMVDEAFVDGLIDFSVFEFTNEICGGDMSKVPRKIVAAIERGIPLVLSFYALDFFGWTRGLEFLPEKYRSRKVHAHNPMVALVETSEEERLKVARIVAERVNMAQGSVTVLVPTEGFSRQDMPDGPFYDPEGTKRLVGQIVGILKSTIRNPNVKVEEVKAHINDETFAERAVKALCKMFNEQHLRTK